MMHQSGHAAVFSLLGDEPANQLPPEGVTVHQWSEFVAAGRASEEAIDVADDPFALNTLIYTSGTTGNPKGVMLTNWNTLSNILCVQSAFKIYVGDKNAAFLPWAHSFGSTFDLHWMIRCGVHINLISDLTKIADECIEIKPAVLLAVPRVWNKFYDRVNSQFEAATGLKKVLIGKAKKSAAKRIAKAGVECDAVPASGFFDKLYDKLVWSKVRARFGGNIRFCMSGAAALSPDVAEFIQMVGFSCYEGYGLTETSPLVAANGWSGQAPRNFDALVESPTVSKSPSIPTHGTILTDLMKVKSSSLDRTSCSDTGTMKKQPRKSSWNQVPSEQVT